MMGWLTCIMTLLGAIHVCLQSLRHCYLSVIFLLMLKFVVLNYITCIWIKKEIYGVEWFKALLDLHKNIND
jgi:hypothetical protein